MELANVKCLINLKTSKLNDDLREQILKENKDLNLSYLCLLKESLPHVDDVLLTSSWGGVRLYERGDLIELYNLINKAR